MSQQPSPEKLVIWEKLLNGEGPPMLSFLVMRRLFGHVPSAPHCKMCEAPLRGAGQAVLGPLGFRPWPKSPRFCQSCRGTLAKLGVGGLELEISVLFADVRGSTTIAEKMSPTEFTALISRFYEVADKAITDNDGIVDKHLGDGVLGLFVPMTTREQHAPKAVAAARQLIAATQDRGKPWAPVGAGIVNGVAYVGVTSSSDEPDDLTALGDVVNTASRLAGAAAAGEILVSPRTVAAAGIDTARLERRMLTLKGKEEAFEALVIRS
jgi:adenylate cyclase